MTPRLVSMSDSNIFMYEHDDSPVMYGVTGQYENTIDTNLLFLERFILSL